MAGIRPLVQEDIVGVADLVWKVLHEKQGPSPRALHDYFHKLFFDIPWRNDGIVSRVYEDNSGYILGFFGAVPRRMSIQGKPVQIALGSNFALDPSLRKSMVAMQLVKMFMKGPQDISMTDSANENSRQLLRSLGFSVVPVYSLTWARPLRPSRYLMHGISRLTKNSVLKGTETIARPICGLVDSIATSLRISPFRELRPRTIGEELTPENHLTCLNTLPSKQWLMPEYDLPSLRWVMGFVDEQRAFGPIRGVLVRDKDQKILGWFIYYMMPAGVGEVLQIGVDSLHVNEVLDHLFYDAWKHGLTGLHGRLEPHFMQELTMKSCFFLRNGSWTLAHSTRPEILGLFQGGAAYFSRLDGEWCFRVDADRLNYGS